MSAPPSVLVTGPVNGLDDYVAAARRVGWRAHAFPLIAVDPRLPVSAPALPDWIAITSSNALPWLEAAARLAPALLQRPCAVVGERSAERARELGFTVALDPTPDAAALAALLLARAPSGARALWPRGPRSEVLGEDLRRAGWIVDDPSAYALRGVAHDGPLPDADAVFFASPSAVQAFAELDLGGSTGPPLALAIGATTFTALLETAELAFLRTASLPAPTPDGFALALQHLAEAPPSHGPT